MKRPTLYLVASVLIIGAAIVATVSRFAGSPQTQQPGAMGCANHEGHPWNFSEGSLRIGQQRIDVAIADTREEKQKGLSGCEELSGNTGMLFTFEPAGVPSFWMKDTIIPLDIVWIKGDEVLGIVENIQPEPGVVDEDLTRYRPESSVSAALELPAGTTAALGLAPGQTAVLELLQ